MILATLMEETATSIDKTEELQQWVEEAHAVIKEIQIVTGQEISTEIEINAVTVVEVVIEKRRESETTEAEIIEAVITEAVIIEVEIEIKIDTTITETVVETETTAMISTTEEIPQTTAMVEIGMIIPEEVAMIEEEKEVLLVVGVILKNLQEVEVDGTLKPPLAAGQKHRLVAGVETLKMKLQ